MQDLTITLLEPWVITSIDRRHRDAATAI